MSKKTVSTIETKNMYLTVWRFCVVHLVDTNDHLLDTEGVGKQSMLSGLAILRDTSLKLAYTSSNDQHGAISLSWNKCHQPSEFFWKAEELMKILNIRIQLPCPNGDSTG